MAEDPTILEPTPPPAPVPESIPPAEPPPAEPQPDPKDRRAVIANAFKNPTQRGQHAVHQPRDEGRFAGPPQIPAPLAAPAVQRPAMPKAYKLDLQKHWDAIPQEFAAAVHQRELDAEKGIVPLKQRAQEADDLLSEFKPYEMLLKAEGSTPKQAIASLLQTAAIFRTGTPMQKLQQVAGIMQTYGIPFQHLQQMLSGQGAPAVDPQYNQLSQEFHQLKQSWTQQEQQRRESEEQRGLAAIQAFAANPDHAEFDVVQDRMLALLQAPQALGVDLATLSDQERLKAAYDAAIRLHPEAYAREQARQAAKEKAKLQVVQARNAAVQVAGSPEAGPAQAVNPKDRRALLEKNFREYANR